ncbi:MAG: GNAT family N-acetyltransferase [Candidatus Sumerlaeaceae bacterium]
MALLAFLSDPNGYLLLATKGEQVIGSLSGFALRHAFRSEPAFLLYEIDVHPSARRNGIGTALVRQFINEAEMARAYEVWVLTNQSNTPAMSMYTRCGLSRRNLDDVMLEIALSGPGDSHT